MTGKNTQRSKEQTHIESGERKKQKKKREIKWTDEIDVEDIYDRSKSQ